VNAQTAYFDVQCGSREGLVTEHAALVKKQAWHLLSRLPSSVELDDLIQDGMIGLLEAASHFDPAKGVQFETFASQRIRGAMLDQLRRNGWAPRALSRRLRELNQSVARLENRLGREASAREVADDLDLSLDEYHELLHDACNLRLCSLDQLTEDQGESAMHNDDEPADEAMAAVWEHDRGQALVARIAQLPERQQLVLSLYYERGLNLKEIALVLEVSESRVSQILSQTVLKLKAGLQDWSEAI